MGETGHRIFSTVFDRIYFILAGNDDIHKSLDEFKIWPIRPQAMELAALERLKEIIPYTYYGENDVITMTYIRA